MLSITVLSWVLMHLLSGLTAAQGVRCRTGTVLVHGFHRDTSQGRGEWLYLFSLNDLVVSSGACSDIPLA